MHYYFQRGVAWEALDARTSASEPGPEPAIYDVLGRATEEEEELAAARRQQRRRKRQEDEKHAATNALLHGAYGASWRAMFRRRPRVRFNGCYISTVNYIRAGQASGHQITWNSPVHIVTYYRYLRLFRDGSAASLLTTEEPAHVVPHLTREALALHRGGAAPHLPSAVVGQALRGRWRLSGALDAADGDDSGGDVDDDNNNNNNAAAAGETRTEDRKRKTDLDAIPIPISIPNLADVEGDLFIETEGVGPKYVYRMDLALRSAGRAGAGAGANKLVWKGFWSYNKLTDDWAEFGLKNDKPFFFSRVKSYGLGA